MKSKNCTWPRYYLYSILILRIKLITHFTLVYGCTSTKSWYPWKYFEWRNFEISTSYSYLPTNLLRYHQWLMILWMFFPFWKAGNIKGGNIKFLNTNPYLVTHYEKSLVLLTRNLMTPRQDLRYPCPKKYGLPELTNCLTGCHFR